MAIAFEKTEEKRGPGRPVTGKAKKVVSLRLDPDVLEKFKKTGKGWQSRVNEALRVHLKLPR